MNELQLLGPRAYGEALGTAVLKAIAEDFQVDEVLDIPISGEGEHLWIWVEKRGLNTEEAARRIAKAAGVPLRTVSYAGLKDRQALTRQWFSVQLPGKADPDLSVAENDTLKILKTARHKRKLQRGAHSANGFTLRLTQFAGDKPAIEERLQLIAKQGIPNYFGEIRFHAFINSSPLFWVAVAKHHIEIIRSLNYAEEMRLHALANNSALFWIEAFKHLTEIIGSFNYAGKTC